MICNTDETPRTKSLRNKLINCEIKSSTKAKQDLKTLRRPLGDKTNCFSPIKEQCRHIPEDLSFHNISGLSPHALFPLDLDQTLGTTFNDDDRDFLFTECASDESLSSDDIIIQLPLKRRRPFEEVLTVTLGKVKNLEPISKSPRLKNREAHTITLHEYYLWSKVDPEEILRQTQSVKLLKTKSSRSWSDAVSSKSLFAGTKSLRMRIPTPVFTNDHRPRSCIPVISNDYVIPKFIDVKQVANLVDGDKRLTIGEKTVVFSDVKIIDARYPYEFSGGHIKGAINIPKEEDACWQEQLKTEFFNGTEFRNNKTKCIVIHCEFSSKRGPALFDWFRKYDRERPENKYPNLFYTNLFLMEGGYKRFYEKYAGDVDRSLFGVRGYVDENDISFIIKRQSIKRRKNKAITRTIKRTDTRSFDRHLRSKDEGTPTKRRR